MSKSKSKKRWRQGPLRRTLACPSGVALACLFVMIICSSLFISPVQAQPVITTPPLLPQAQVGSTYFTALQAAGGTPPYSWSIISGGLPTGLNFAATGVISGTPTVAGTFNFTARVTDGASATATQPFILTVAQPPLRFLTTYLATATEGKSYTERITVSGGTSPYTWSITSGSLPTGLILGATTGYISGTPARGTAGTYSFIVSVTDSSSPPLTGQESFSIIVEKGGYEATITIGTGLKAGETKVFVNGSEIARLQGGQSMKLSLDLGVSRSVGVEPLVPHPSESGIRFKAEVDRLTVSEASPNANFPYYTEYYIELKAEPSKVGQLSGSGWYRQGYTLRASAPDLVNDPDDPGTQYRFSQWALPTGETVSGRDLSLTVNAPGVCTARYDIYYKLILTSPYGEAEGSNWYKAGSQAEWSITNPQVRMSGILGIFGGKLKAINYSGTTVMDSPKTVEISWEPDYTMPLIMIPMTIILLILGGYGLYLLLRNLQPKPVLYPPPYYQPMPPPPPQPAPPPTVVMIGGEKPKLGPPSTKEQLMEKFAELLERYEEEIKTTLAAKGLPEVKTTIGEEKGLPPPGAVTPTAIEAEVIPEDKGATCSYTAKKPLRIVTSEWRQAETRNVVLPPVDEKQTEGETGIAVVWARDIYQEWKILHCWLPQGHKEAHDGGVETVYSRLNTVTEERVYRQGQEPRPPAPHYTDGMPQVQIAVHQLVTPDKLPPETLT